jgi:hypothetical protein
MPKSMKGRCPALSKPGIERNWMNLYVDKSQVADLSTIQLEKAGIKPAYATLYHTDGALFNISSAR